jgi:hypothetical protein
MYVINKFQCAKGHTIQIIQIDTTLFCPICFKEWQKETFPLTQIIDTNDSSDE